jgi:TetR/AcrR family transcriptional regulator
VPPVSAPRQRRKDARPQELLDAALEVFVEKGFAAARTDDVAQRAGVSKGTLYLYYPSKTDLLKAVITAKLRGEIERGRQIVLAHRGSATSLMRDFVAPWWQQLYASPASGVFKIMVAEARNFPEVADFYAREVMQPGEEVLTQVVQIGIDSGEFAVALADVKHTVYSLLLPVVMACIHKHSLGACPIEECFDPPSFIREHIELVLRSMGVPPAASAPAPQTLASA